LDQWYAVHIPPHHHWSQRSFSSQLSESVINDSIQLSPWVQAWVDRLLLVFSLPKQGTQDDAFGMRISPSISPRALWAHGQPILDHRLDMTVLTSGLDANTNGFTGRWVFSCTMRIPRFTKFDPGLLPDIISLYQVHRPLLESAKQQLTTMSYLDTKKFVTTPIMIKAHADQLRICGMVLLCSLILNAVLRAYDPSDMLLVGDFICLSREVCLLAEDAAAYRPLGASYMSLCYMVMWGATSDKAIKADAEKLMAEHGSDFLGSRGLRSAKKLQRKFQRLQFDASSHAQRQDKGLSSATVAGIENLAGEADG
jgi:hypothetical protein